MATHNMVIKRKFYFKSTSLVHIEKEIIIVIISDALHRTESVGVVPLRTHKAGNPVTDWIRRCKLRLKLIYQLPVVLPLLPSIYYCLKLNSITITDILNNYIVLLAERVLLGRTTELPVRYYVYRTFVAIRIYITLDLTLSTPTHHIVTRRENALKTNKKIY